MDFQKDYEEDLAFLKELKAKEKNPLTVEQKITERLNFKYSREFNMYRINVKVNTLEKTWVLDCGKDMKMKFEDIDFYDIAERVRFFRELAARKKK